ncbi:MAG: SBBP repeat-containing protein [Acidobacteria bacterium]|nr:SBBP repeat-containing protein [Acidobacteriota bacterium]
MWKEGIPAIGKALVSSGKDAAICAAAEEIIRIVAVTLAKRIEERKIPEAGQQFGGSDAFVTKLTADGALTYSTYLGGSGAETGFGIKADASGNAYVTGFTDSTNFPTVNPIQANKGGGLNVDVFVTKLNSQGSALVYSTYLGGTGAESGRGIAIDSANNVYVTGASGSGDFPLVAGALRTRSPMYKSIDGAASWTNDNYGFGGTVSSNFGGSSVTALAIHPTEPGTIYAGSGAGVFKTTNGGRTWSAMNNGPTSRNVTALVINPSAPSTLYIATSNFPGSGVYKSTDGGSTWNLRSSGLNHTDFLSLAIDPVTPNTLYIGVNFCCVVGTHIYKTTNGSDSWAPIAGAPPVVPSSIVIDPLNHLSICVADSASLGAVYKSPDAGTTWQNLGLSGSPARFVAASPLTAGLVYAGTDQGLFRSVNSGANWSQIPSRKGKVVFDPVNAATAYLLTDPLASLCRAFSRALTTDKHGFP